MSCWTHRASCTTNHPALTIANSRQINESSFGYFPAISQPTASAAGGEYGNDLGNKGKQQQHIYWDGAFVLVASTEDRDDRQYGAPRPVTGHERMFKAGVKTGAGRGFEPGATGFYFGRRHDSAFRGPGKRSTRSAPRTSPSANPTSASRSAIRASMNCRPARRRSPNWPASARCR